MPSVTPDEADGALTPFGVGDNDNNDDNGRKPTIDAKIKSPMWLNI